MSCICILGLIRAVHKSALSAHGLTSGVCWAAGLLNRLEQTQGLHLDRSDDKESGGDQHSEPEISQVGIEHIPQHCSTAPVGCDDVADGSLHWQ